MRLFVKSVFVVILIVLVFLVYSYGSSFLASYVFDHEYPRTYHHMVSEAIFGAILVALVFSYPIYRIYNHLAYLVACVGYLGVLSFRVPDIINYWERDNSIVIMGVVEIVLPIAVLVCGVKLASRYAADA